MAGLTQQPAAKDGHTKGRLLAAGIALLTLFAVWFALCLRYVAFPNVDPYERVDAVYVIGPAEGRIEQARELANRYDAEALMVTVTVDTNTGIVYEKNFCELQDGYEVICVKPDPYTTQGEAQQLAANVAERGWGKVAVLTGTTHISRARLWMERYVDVELLMWEAPEARSLLEWANAFVYQSAAWAKAMLPGR